VTLAFDLESYFRILLVTSGRAFGKIVLLAKLMATHRAYAPQDISFNYMYLSFSVCKVCVASFLFIFEM